MTVQIVKCSSETELFRQYPTELSAQPAYIGLDLRRQLLLADYDGEIGGGVPAEVFHGFERRYSIPVLTAAAANEVMDEIAPLAARIVADWEESWDGSNMVAQLGSDARQAEAEIEDILGVGLSPEQRGFADHDLVMQWDLEGALHGDEVAEYGITAETTDERLDEIEADILAALTDCGEGAVAVCPELADHLRTLRDELAAD